VTFWGSPWTPWFFDWAFNAPKGDEKEEFLTAHYDEVPDATDVLLVHGPPRGFGDHTASGMDVGSTAFLDLIDRADPQLAVFGHIHEGRGDWTRGSARLLNVSAVDLQYALRDEPFVVVDLPAKPGPGGR
jgi:Icc-related predicted phosphoesterase